MIQNDDDVPAQPYEPVPNGWDVRPAPGLHCPDDEDKN